MSALPHLTLSGWRTFGRVLLFFIACAALLAVISPVARDFTVVPPGLFIGAVTSLGTLVLTAVFVRSEALRLGDVGAAINSRSPLRFAFGFIVGLVLVALHMSIVGFAGNVQWVRSQGVGFLDIVMSLMTYFLLSCREELAFRGYPLRRLHSFYGLWASQLIVALVFAAEHVAGGSTWTQALFGAGVGSLLFGMASIATKGLAIPIGLHAAWNFGDWMHGGKNSTGLWHPVLAEGLRDRAELAGTIGYVMVMISATLAFWWLSRQGLKKTEAFL